MIKYREKIRLLMLHVSLICAVVIMAAGILDWFNPYMNFSGQIGPFRVLLVCALIFLALTAAKANGGRETGCRNRKRRGR